MEKSASNKQRIIFDDLVKEIDENKTALQGKKRSIFFRNDKRNKKERQVYSIPIIYLKYRKDNGRIASNVASEEKRYGEVKEATDIGQGKLREFLEEKDKERTEELKRTIIDRGQDEPAVITADGFLINGNRRKMVLEILSEKYPANQSYKSMEVIILPGKKDHEDDEPAPSYYEIEQIESAYQFHTHGKSEYTNFDKALSIRRKLDNGMTIEEQLSYDASFNMLTPAKKRSKIRQIEEDFLKPLKCIDQYLSRLDRKGLYNTIAAEKGSKKGQWQAFIDYYKYVDKYLTDSRKFTTLKVDKNEKGIVQDIAFKIIRARDIKGVDKKSHEIMRLMPKLLSKEESKKELFKLKDIKLKSHGETAVSIKDAEIKDLQWYQSNANEIIHHVRKAYNHYLGEKESETPLDLLLAAYRKLDHSNMNIEAIDNSNYKQALQLAEKVRDKADDIKKMIWETMNN